MCRQLSDMGAACQGPRPGSAPLHTQGSLQQAEWDVTSCPRCWDESVQLTPGRGRTPRSHDLEVCDRLELLLKDLFRLHDLNNNGLLEEEELVQLNMKVALLHYGSNVDNEAVERKYRALFRSKLSPEGLPVSFMIFRRHVMQVLENLDSDPLAHEMILEQFVAEADAARASFNCDFDNLVNDHVKPIDSMIAGKAFPSKAVPVEADWPHVSQISLSSSNDSFSKIFEELSRVSDTPINPSTAPVRYNTRVGGG